MNNKPHSLESLVPPLELCKKIPPGRFIDSALVWLHVDGEWDVYSRYEDVDGSECGEIPAPTLQEIIDQLGNLDMWRDADKNWEVFSNDSENVRHERETSPSTAALKLWLKIYHQ